MKPNGRKKKWDPSKTIEAQDNGRKIEAELEFQHEQLLHRSTMSVGDEFNVKGMLWRTQARDRTKVRTS